MKDIERRRDYAEDIVQEVLKNNLACFKDLYFSHPAFQNQSKMSQKSKIISLGLQLKNPSGNNEMLEILQELHKYLPHHNNDNKIPPSTVFHGDGITMERMNTVLQVKQLCLTFTDRLEGILHTPGEFHKRMLNQADTYKLLYKAEKASDQGTLANVAKILGINVGEGKTNKYFNDMEQLLHVTTEGLIVKVGMELLGMDSMTRSLDPNSNMQEVLEKTAHEIVAYFWIQPSMSDVSGIIDAETPDAVYCNCQSPCDDRNMVECGNVWCEWRWFHYDYVSYGGEEEWFCSEACKTNVTASPHCVCRKRMDMPTVLCSNQQCETKVFHQQCVGVVESLDVVDTWCCSQDCYAATKLTQDHVLAYSKALGHKGLMDMVQRLMLRNGDGEAIIGEWRSQAIDFFREKHNKYLIIMHNLLTGVAGTYSNREAYLATHNRVLNIHGGDGLNIPLDRYNEFLNLSFKGMAKRSNGSYTDSHLCRVAMLAGPLAQQLDSIYSTQVANTYLIGVG